MHALHVCATQLVHVAESYRLSIISYEALKQLGSNQGMLVWGPFGIGNSVCVRILTKW